MNLKVQHIPVDALWWLWWSREVYYALLVAMRSTSLDMVFWSEFQLLGSEEMQVLCGDFGGLIQWRSAHRCALFATVTWCLWQMRNRVRVHQPSWSLHDCFGNFRMFIKGSRRDLLVDLQCIGHLRLKFASRKILMLLSSMGQIVLG